MKTPNTRRAFLSDVGCGMLVASIGLEVATSLQLVSAEAAEADGAVINFGKLEPLVALMQEMSADKLLPALVSRLRSGTDLRQMVAAGALANARTFGGEDYVGFHTLMAMAPAFHMSQELPREMQALPVFKVLYRNTNRIQEQGGRQHEVLHSVEPDSSPGSRLGGEVLRDAVRSQNLMEAERTFARLAQGPADEAFNHLLYAVQDGTEVHRVVLPYRAWDMLGLIGKDHAHTLLRQSVRYCVKAESWSGGAKKSGPRTLLPKLLEEHKLLGRTLGERTLDDAALDQLCLTIFQSTAEQAASAVAAALAEGIAPATVGEALTLAANQLILRDMGRTPRDESPGKPMGTVHGDSIGVHATDSANAWRNMSRIANLRNSFACLILGAYQVAQDRTDRGGDFLNWKPLPYGWQHEQIQKQSDASGLLRDAEEAIRGNLQARAAALIHRYGELGHPPRPVFDLLLRYAVSEDGALHAEKFYRTASEEFASTRASFRWRHLVALARVTASEFGRPAAGIAQAKELLKV